jgi:hypothetical protein
MIESMSEDDRGIYYKSCLICATKKLKLILYNGRI